MKINYRLGRIEDLDQVEALQKRYHVDTISAEDKPDGFVTTLFTRQQFIDLIEKENGLMLACHGDKVVAYAMNASWQYWSQWPLFAYMIEDLPNTSYLGEKLSVDNSFQYGPVCILTEFRSKGILEDLFEFSRFEMNKRYPYLITFINQINPRSFKAHKRVGLDLIKEFQFNNNNYYELGYDTNKKVENSTLDL